MLANHKLHYHTLIVQGEKGKIVRWAFKMDFNKTAPYNWERAEGMINHRHRHGCGMISVKKTFGKSKIVRTKGAIGARQ